METKSIQAEVITAEPLSKLLAAMRPDTPVAIHVVDQARYSVPARHLMYSQDGAVILMGREGRGNDRLSAPGK